MTGRFLYKARRAISAQTTVGVLQVGLPWNDMGLATRSAVWEDYVLVDNLALNQAPNPTGYEERK